MIIIGRVVEVEAHTTSHAQYSATHSCNGITVLF